MMQRYLKKYSDNYVMWTQLVGCIGIFGSIFVFMWEFKELGSFTISLTMGIIGFVICGVNKVVDDIDFKESQDYVLSRLKNKIAKGELPPDRLDQYRKMF